jgi:hypothetical protein
MIRSNTHFTGQWVSGSYDFWCSRAGCYARQEANSRATNEDRGFVIADRTGFQNFRHSGCTRRYSNCVRVL